MRFGRFKVSEELICDEESNKLLSDSLALMEFIPTRVEQIYHVFGFYYVGLSPLFRDIEPGRLVPEYWITFNGNSVTVEELK